MLERDTLTGPSLEYKNFNERCPFPSCAAYKLINPVWGIPGSPFHTHAGSDHRELDDIDIEITETMSDWQKQASKYVKIISNWEDITN